MKKPKNAEVESFFKTLKGELLHATSFVTMRKLRKHIKDYIEGLYNSHRLHSGLGYRTPIEFEGIIGQECLVGRGKSTGLRLR